MLVAADSQLPSLNEPLGALLLSTLILKDGDCNLQLPIGIQNVKVHDPLVGLDLCREHDDADPDDLISGKDDPVRADDDGQELLVEREYLVVLENLSEKYF